MKFPPATYDTETVRQMVELATGAPATLQDVANLCRPGCAMADAVLRRGVFQTHKTRRVIEQLTRRRLAFQLGRTSPRFLGDEATTACPHCAGIAVLWDGVTLCENGHQTLTESEPE